MTPSHGSGILPLRVRRKALTTMLLILPIVLGSTSAFLCPTTTPSRRQSLPITAFFASNDGTTTTTATATTTQEKRPSSTNPFSQHDDHDEQPPTPPTTHRWKKDAMPMVKFMDPETQCQVVLLGCFHGTQSSSKDVAWTITSETNTVVLELCPSRFLDLKRELIQQQQQQQQEKKKKVESQSELDGKPIRDKVWIVAYWEMIVKTVNQRGWPTGIAAAILGGVSGLQTALSGFTPGLEFRTALERAQAYDCDVILADQDVDETLRRVGSLPKIALDTALSPTRLDRWKSHHETLLRAVMGQDQDPEGLTKNGIIPQVRLPAVLVRNSEAVQDLVRLTIPPTLFFWTIASAIAAMTGIEISSNAAADAYYNSATISEKILHWVASGGMLAAGYLGVTLPAVSVILTERDEILTKGIQAACRRAGKGGQVVAVVGLLHVNGVAARMLAVPSNKRRESISEDR